MSTADPLDIRILRWLGKEPSYSSCTGPRYATTQFSSAQEGRDKPRQPDTGHTVDFKTHTLRPPHRFDRDAEELGVFVVVARKWFLTKRTYDSSISLLRKNL